jgi:HNH endonuclease
VSAEPADTDRGTTLAELSHAWQQFGCAVCGQITRPTADPGFRIELHHLVPRARGGTDDPANLMGLCGELLPNKCHWRVTTNRMVIEQMAVGWVWRDVGSGDTGLCRPLVLSLAAETGLDRVLTAPIEMRKDRSVSKRPVPQERAEAVAKAEGFDPTDISMPGVEGAERRFAMARELNHRAERAWMVMAVVIQKGMMMGDPKTLGFEDYQEWGDAIGVSTTLMSKLRMIGKQFAGSWEMLPEADKAMLSMEGLYIAARMVKLGRWTEEEALHEAVAQPVHRLWHAYKIEEEVFKGEREHHACPICGFWHLEHAERNTSKHEHRLDRPHRREKP